jgi:hypothetical protein
MLGKVVVNISFHPGKLKVNSVHVLDSVQSGLIVAEETGFREGRALEVAQKVFCQLKQHLSLQICRMHYLVEHDYQRF